MEPTAPLNLMILGKTQAGKSSSGNTIVGQEAFGFKKRNVAVQSSTVYGFPVNVFDTPGFCDTEMSDEKIKQIYEEVFQKCDSGPCAFLLVIKADRFTEDRETVEKIEKFLGENRLQKTWILFTGGDKLQQLNMTIRELLDRNEGLKTLVEKYNQRFHVFNNTMRGPSDQARLLLVNIHQKSLGLKNGGRMTRQIPVRPNTCNEPENPADSLSSRRIVLLGKSGVGKSAAGNTILGLKKFKSELCMDSVTSECSEKHGIVSGRSVSVVDTPGLFDTQLTHKEIMMEIAKSVYLSSPGPHAFLIVFPVNMRFTEHEQQIPQVIEMMFGQEVLKYSIILFTHGDLLKGKPIEELINKNAKLRHLVQQCGGRFNVFNNEDENNREQNTDLLQMIDTMIEQNDGYYSNQMYEDAHRFRQMEKERRKREEEETKLQVEKQIQEETERLMKEKEQRIREEMEAKQRSELERVKAERQREEEQRKQQEEKQRREEMQRVRIETEKKTREEMEAKQRSELERVKAEREREEQRKQQEEKQRREEMQRVRIETEKKTREEMEAKQRSELERVKAEREREEQRKQQEEKQRREEMQRVRLETEKKTREEMEAKQRSELERVKAERQREEEQRKQQEEKQIQKEIERVRKEIEKKIRAEIEEKIKEENKSHTEKVPEITEFSKQYEPELNLSAIAANKNSHTGLGAICGSVLGGAVGLFAGPAGAAAGASLGAAAGAAISNFLARRLSP